MFQRCRLYHPHVLDEETGIETVNDPKLIESGVCIWIYIDDLSATKWWLWSLYSIKINDCLCKNVSYLRLRSKLFYLCISIIHTSDFQWWLFCPSGTNIPHLAMSGDIVGCHYWGRKCCRHLLGSGQRCCGPKMPTMHRTASTTQNCQRWQGWYSS